MQRPSVIPALNRLLQTLLRSLPVYLEQTHPWTRPGEEEACAALKAVAADQRASAARVAEAIRQRRGRLDTGRFPTEFTDLHDLSVDFLVRRVLEYHQRDLQAIRRSLQELEDDRELRALAEEILHQAMAHQQQLQALVKKSEE